MNKKKTAVFLLLAAIIAASVFYGGQNAGLVYVETQTPISRTEIGQWKENSAFDRVYAWRREDQIFSSSGNRSAAAAVYYMTAAENDLLNAQSGRLWLATDQIGKWAVVDEQFAVSLWGHTDVTGEKLILKDQIFEVIGVTRRSSIEKFLEGSEGRVYLLSEPDGEADHILCGVSGGYSADLGISIIQRALDRAGVAGEITRTDTLRDVRRWIAVLFLMLCALRLVISCRKAGKKTRFPLYLVCAACFAGLIWLTAKMPVAYIPEKLIPSKVLESLRRAVSDLNSAGIPQNRWTTGSMWGIALMLPAEIAALMLAGEVLPDGRKSEK